MRLGYHPEPLWWYDLIHPLRFLNRLLIHLGKSHDE